jgi:hypothetical protein
MIVIGIDPGARYTAISVRDGDELLLSSTYVRPKELPPITWAVTVTKQIMEDIIPLYPDAPIGIEGITDPNAYNQGVKSLNNPKHLIHLGFVVGALAGAFPKAVIVRPGKNGTLMHSWEDDPKHSPELQPEQVQEITKDQLST